MRDIYDFGGDKDGRKTLGMCFFYSTALSRRTGIECKDRLRKLVIIGQQDLTHMPAISELMELEELWIVECGIKEAPSFQSHKNLEKLCLYMNDMKNIPDLTGCVRLKILHMSSNNIRDFKNLDKIPSLQKLILADNKIERLDEEFPRKSQLRYINLSGNPLYRIQDTKNLAVLQKLNSVVFADPLYEMCPISIMCNYRPYIIKNLPHLKNLDHYPICRGEKHWVAYSLREQASYHNMILHTQFNFSLEALKHKYVQYRKMIKDLKAQFFAINKKRDTATKTPHQMALQLKSINEQVEEWEEEFMTNLKIYKQQSDLSMFFWGNISFAEYNASEGNKVVHLCQSILEDSLCSNIRDIGMIGIVLHKVVKVMSHEITCQINCKRKTDYLSLDINNVVFKILSSQPGIQSIGHWPFEFFESGLFTTKEVLVTDCLAIADRDWLSNNWDFEKKLATDTSYRSRRICILVQTPTNIQPKRGGCKEEYGHFPKAHNQNNCEKHCHQYRLETHKIKSPIFVIEYQYVSSKPTKTDAQCNDKDAHTVNEDAKILYRNDSTARIFNIAQDKAFNLEKICLSGQDLEIIDLQADLPNLRELDISYNRITAFPNENILRQLKSLDVSFNNIKVVSIINVLPMLENLNISWNDLCSCMATCQTLIKYTPNLSELDIQYNPFVDCVDQKQIYHILESYLPKLHLTATSCIGTDSLSSEILSLCTEYTCKQFARQCSLNDIEKNCSLSSVGSKGRQDHKQSKYIHIDHNPSVINSVFKKKTKVEQLCASFCYIINIPIVKPMKFLTKLNLSSNFISSVDCLTQANFPVLKYLDLSKNLISSLQLMQHFHTLEEFYCAHNHISNIAEIENLRSWYMLTILDLYRNPVDAADLYKKFIICHLPNIKYISGKYVQYAEILEAKYAFGIVLDVNILSCTYKADYLQAITQLSLTNSSLKKVHLYSDMIPYLESLNLSRNKISIVWGLHTFQHLRTLCLSYNALESFGEGSGNTGNVVFPNLSTLLLDHNNIGRIGNFSKITMPKIKYVFLNDNNIHSLDEITGCPSLEALIVDYNNIEKLSAELEEENNLKLLSLECNKIESLQFIQYFQKLERLYLANNAITNECEIDLLKSLKNLKELTLIGNPVFSVVFENDGFEIINATKWKSENL